MTIVPIFIHVHEKSDEEIRGEMARDARMRKAIEEDEARARHRKWVEEEKKREIEREREEWREKKYEEERQKNPWDFQILPEGWSPFGQLRIELIQEEFNDEWRDY